MRLVSAVLRSDDAGKERERERRDGRSGPGIDEDDLHRRVPMIIDFFAILLSVLMHILVRHAFPSFIT